MLSDQQIEDFVKAFPSLGEDSKLLEKIRSNAIFMRIPGGKTICHEHQSAQSLPLLKNGVIRVLKLGESGREISLYHIIRGESCILTASSILSSRPFPAIAEAESDSEVFLVPESRVSPWLIEFPTWRNFIYDLFGKRMGEVIAVVEEVAFQRVDRRIASLLLTLPRDKNSEITITHHAIATEIGTAREVVTRVLRDLNSKSIVRLARGSIIIINETKLNELSHE